MMPTFAAIAFAVMGWSPVTMTTYNPNNSRTHKTRKAQARCGEVHVISVKVVPTGKLLLIQVQVASPTTSLCGRNCER
uniref:Secreted protein n=1 Tax=Electrophorus electricus TaxID=8005 RepID=A0A4W4GUP8_ELEEL